MIGPPLLISTVAHNSNGSTETMACSLHTWPSSTHGIGSWIVIGNSSPEIRLIACVWVSATKPLLNLEVTQGFAKDQRPTQTHLRWFRHKIFKHPSQNLGSQTHDVCLIVPIYIGGLHVWQDLGWLVPIPMAQVIHDGQHW